MEANYPGMPAQQAVLSGNSAVVGYAAGSAQQTQKNNGPAGKWRSGSITVTKWVNMRNINGRQVPVESFVIEKHYKDAQGNWQTTKYLTKGELVKAYFLIQKVLSEDAETA